jgi:hypothetical protein
MVQHIGQTICNILLTCNWTSNVHTGPYNQRQHIAALPVWHEHHVFWNVILSYLLHQVSVKSITWLCHISFHRSPSSFSDTHWKLESLHGNLGACIVIAQRIYSCAGVTNEFWSYFAGVVRDNCEMLTKMFTFRQGVYA